MARFHRKSVPVVDAAGNPVLDANGQQETRSYDEPFTAQEEVQWDALEAQAPARQRDQLIAAVTIATQSRLDSFARTRNYDGILSACTYAASSNAKFAAEGAYCMKARDDTWATLYAVLAQVQAGTRPMPSGYADIAPELPALTWPA